MTVMTLIIRQALFDNKNIKTKKKKKYQYACHHEVLKDGLESYICVS